MPSDADGDAQTACQNQRSGKYEDFFILGLTPSGLKRKTHQALTEDPKKMGRFANVDNQQRHEFSN